MVQFEQMTEEERAAVDAWIDDYRQRCRAAGNTTVDTATWLEFAREAIANPCNAAARARHVLRRREEQARAKAVKLQDQKTATDEPGPGGNV